MAGGEEAEAAVAAPAQAEEQLVRPLVIFDFDWSLINENSDTWILEQLRPELDFKGHMRKLEEQDPACRASWTVLMDRMVQHLHEAGVSRSELLECLVRIPYYEEMLEAVRWSRAQGCELAIVSDANEVFISTILAHHGLLDAFCEVHTNFAAFEADGAGPLRVAPYNPFDRPHGCARCPPNMCKGSIVQRMLAARPCETRAVYVGDGGGDFCASLALRPGDWVCGREGYPLLRRLRSPTGREALRAGVHPWRDGADILAFLRRRIRAL